MSVPYLRIYDVEVVGLVAGIPAGVPLVCYHSTGVLLPTRTSILLVYITIVRMYLYD